MDLSEPCPGSIKAVPPGVQPRSARMPGKDPHPPAGDSSPESARLRLKSFGIAADDSSRAYLHQRVEGKLGKFAVHIQALEIRMKRMGWVGNWPRISCALSATLDGGGRVTVERFATEARAAFDHTMGVAEQVIRRTLQHLRHQQLQGG